MSKKYKHFIGKDGLLHDSHRMSGREMTAKYQFNSVAEMEKYMAEGGGWKEAGEQVMRPLKVRHFEDEELDRMIAKMWAEETRTGWEDNTGNE